MQEQLNCVRRSQSRTQGLLAPFTSLSHAFYQPCLLRFGSCPSRPKRLDLRYGCAAQKVRSTRLFTSAPVSSLFSQVELLPQKDKYKSHWTWSYVRLRNGLILQIRPLPYILPNAPFFFKRSLLRFSSNSFAL